MATINNCQVPEDLYYWISEHVWVRPEADGTITIGMTDAAQNLAGAIINATPKDAGRPVKFGKSTGTVESGKWVGPIKSPVNGVIVAANQAVRTNPKILNQDPYGQGWFVRVKPDNWEADKVNLVSGSEAVANYQAFLNEKGITCKPKE